MNGFLKLFALVAVMNQYAGNFLSKLARLVGATAGVPGSVPRNVICSSVHVAEANGARNRVFCREGKFRFRTLMLVIVLMVTLAASSEALAQPGGLSASDGSYTNKVHITWNSVFLATGYQVARAPSPTGTKTTLTGWQGSRVHEDTGAIPGETYYYFVRAQILGIPTGWSSYNTGWRRLLAPTGVSASDGTYTDRVRITWSSVWGGYAYRVHRATSAQGTYLAFGWQSGTTYDDTSATPGVTYYYRVTAAADAGYRESSYSSYNTGWRQLSTLTVNSSGASGVSISSSTGHGGTTNYTRPLLTLGTSVTLTAPSAASGRTFTGWTGYVTSNSPTISFSMNADRTLTANYTSTADYVAGTWKGKYTDDKGRSGRIRRVKIRDDGSVSGQWQENLSKYGGSGTAWLPLSGSWTYSSGTYYINVSGSKKIEGHATNTSVSAGATVVNANRLTGPYDSTVEWKAGGNWHTRSPNGTFVLNRLKPGRPRNVNATNGTITSYCLITWDPVFGANQYRVWRSKKPDTKKIALGPWQTADYFKHVGTPGKKFYYWVKARNSAGTSPFSKYDRGWRGFSTAANATLDKAAQNTVNEHLYALGISRGLDYPVTAEGNLNHQFFLEAETDATVQLIDVITPAGANFTITDEPNTQSGPVRTWHYEDQNNHYWQYKAQADEANALADYTDGLYIITITYQTGGQDTTTLEFADPNTGDAIQQPTEQPVLTAPEHNATVASPVTFTWQPCNDGNVTSICLDLENQDADDDLFILLSPDDSEAGPASLTPGTWQAELSFDNFLEFENPDGVPVSAGKYNIADYTFDVEPEDEQP